MAVWAEHCTTTRLSKSHSGCWEKNPPPKITRRAGLEGDVLEMEYVICQIKFAFLGLDTHQTRQKIIEIVYSKLNRITLKTGKPKTIFGEG